MNEIVPSQIKKITDQFAKKTIVVFGDVGIDKYTMGKVTRISPEAPIPIVEVIKTELKLGLASNVADNLTTLGAEVLTVGMIGDDNEAEDFKILMKRKKMNSSYLVVDRKRKTTLKERVVAENQQVVRIDHETKNKPNSKTLKEVWNKLQKAVKKADAIIIEDYAKGLVDVSICRQLVALAEKKKIPVFVDPNANSNVQLYYGTSVLTPNINEVEHLSGIKIVDRESLYLAGYKFLEETNSQIVIITRGKDGMAIFARGETEPVLIPTFAREVFDVSGAGDTTIATLALCLVSGASVIESALIANYAAGVVVGKRGTATVTVQEIKDYISFVKSQNEKQKKKTNISN